MIICCTIDSRYAEFAAVLFYSIERNGDLPEAQFAILGDRLTENEQRDIQSSVGRAIKFMDVESELRTKISSLPTTGPWPPFIYSRLFLPAMFAGQAEKLLYLDADTIVKKSLRPLADLDMGDNAIAAVAQPGKKAATDRLGLPEGCLTFNSGVLLFDIASWNRKGLTDKAIEAVHDSNITLKCPDQDALIIAAQGNLLTIPPAYNAGKGYGDYSTASIVHFTHGKPNKTDYKHPEKETYLEYRSHTPWKQRPLMTPLRQTLLKWRKSVDKRLRKLAFRSN